MDGLRNPVGDLPPEVYWRRRIVIGAGAVILIAILWFLITSPRGGDEKAGPGTSPTPHPSLSIGVSPSPGATVDVARACTTTDVGVSAVAVGSPFAAGTLPVFDVTVTMNGTTPCKLTVDPENSLLSVRSGNDRIFNSQDCAADPTITTREFILQPGADTQVFELTWNRQRSAEGCVTVNATPREGTYRATVTLQGIASEEAVFQLG